MELDNLPNTIRTIYVDKDDPRIEYIKEKYPHINIT